VHALRHPRPTLAKGHTAMLVSALTAAPSWRRVSWRDDIYAPRAARVAVCRMTPAHDRQQTLASEVWLLREGGLDGSYDDRLFLVNLSLRKSFVRLVTLSHERRAIEQQYQQLKTELSLDHLEGLRCPEWHSHVALTAVASAFLQCERTTRDPAITFETIPAIVQEFLTRLILASYPHFLAWLTDARATLPLWL
jgi:hypothetical protein